MISPGAPGDWGTAREHCASLEERERKRMRGKYQQDEKPISKTAYLLPS